MAKLVSTSRPLNFEGGTAGLGRRPPPPRCRVVRGHQLHFAHFSCPALLVEAIRAVRRFGYALVAITERHLHAAGRTFKFDTLERGSDFAGGWPDDRTGQLLR